MTYAWRPGSRYPGDAEIVANELEEIRITRGKLEAPAVVEVAASDESPLHSFFEWDDSVAAHEHRLRQARSLIRAVVIVSDDQPAKSLYVHVSSPDETVGDYVPLTLVAQHPDRYLVALTEANAGLRSAQHRVDELLAVARTTGHPEGEVARIMLASAALANARDAIAQLVQ